MDFNLNNLTQSTSGVTKFSGVSSGIDSQAIIDSIIATKRLQVNNIEDKIALNDRKVAAIDQLQSLTKNFATQLNALRGSTSFFSEDVFDKKLAFTESQSTATAPGNHTPSSASSILGVTVGDDAIAGSHTVEVLQLAKAQQIRSDAFSDTSSTLASLGYTTGSFDINGQTINISGTDTLLDLRDKINAANTGANASGVSASIVSVSATEHYLVLGSDDTGLTNTINFSGTQAVHNSLGLTRAGQDVVKTEIQAAQNAIVRVDNLGVNIERESNTINDIFGGVTLDLFKAEPDTEIVVDIENDLNAVKASIVSFMDAYNELKSFIEDQQSEAVRSEDGDAEYGALAFDSTLKQVEARLSSIVSSNVPGVASGFQSLGQIGISIEDDFSLKMDESKFDDVLLNNLSDVRKIFAFDYTTSDTRVRVISPGANSNYSVDGSGNPVPYYVNLAGTDANGNVMDGNIYMVAGMGNGGLGNNTLSVSGTTLTATPDTGMNSMKLFFNGGANAAPVNDVEITYTRGVADRLYNFFNDFSKVGGEADTLKTNLLNQNDDYSEDIDKIDGRLEIQRKNLEARFIAMETAMLQLNNLKESLSQQIAAMAGEDK